MNTYIIIDDEPIAHEIIEEYCNMLPHLKLEKNCYNAKEAILFLNENTIDFMFLDINMPKLSGLDFLRTLTNPPKAIITTAYEEFALEGFDLSVNDYLLKPFSFDRLMKAINKVITNDNHSPKKEGITEVDSSSRKQKFFVKGDKKHYYIDANEILFIEAYGNYTKLFLKNEMIISNEKISYYEIFLKSKNFIRTHKSFIVPLDKIRLIEGNRIQIENHSIPIGLTYKSTISKLYNN
jgi:DNA-binding LytR/AlgR family response regulator